MNEQTRGSIQPLPSWAHIHRAKPSRCHTWFSFMLAWNIQIGTLTPSSNLLRLLSILETDISRSIHVEKSTGSNFMRWSQRLDKYQWENSSESGWWGKGKNREGWPGVLALKDALGPRQRESDRKYFYFLACLSKWCENWVETRCWNITSAQ